MAITRDALFLAFDAGASVPESDGIYLSDGTATGTFEALPLAQTSFYPEPIDDSAALDYGLVFALRSSLYTVDPSTGLPARLDVPALASPQYGFVSLGPVAFFPAIDTSGVSGLWRTDGTVAGTYAIVAGATNPTRVGARVVFQAATATGTGLYAIDAASNIALLAQLPQTTSQAAYKPVAVTGGRLILETTGQSPQLWSTDGTVAGTAEFTASPPGPGSGAALANGSVVFTDGRNLYVTDGASAPTLIDTPAGLFARFTSFAGRAFFTAGTLQQLSHLVSSLWITDGTTAGTQSISAGVGTSGGLGRTIDAGLPIDFGAGALFLTSDPYEPILSNTGGLWITDGTVAGTHEIAANIAPKGIAVDASRAFVLESDGLYVTDRTSAGTTLVSAQSVGLFGSLLINAARVAVAGTHTQYALAPTSTGGLQIADAVANRDGAATYADARVVAFSDGVGVLDPTGNAQALARIYEATYGRAPDIFGLIAYTEALDGGTVSLAQIAAASANSPEFIADYGNLSDTAFVARMYQNADGRASDAPGLAGYVGALSSGQTRGAVLLDIAESFEARQHSLAVAGNALDATVYRLYEAVDARAPDASGQATYSAALAFTQSVQQIAATFLAAAEYAQKFGAPDDATFVTELYANLLGRAPDSGGLSAYTASLAAGTTRAAVAEAFVTGDEGRLATSVATRDGWVWIG